ncbi:MAG: hypothetical protein H6707_20025 [Deltaproteobacteria bacterium]|nr:hypothetical protein [Deltaproteobacteria bacterium]
MERSSVVQRRSSRATIVGIVVLVLQSATARVVTAQEGSSVVKRPHPLQCDLVVSPGRVLSWRTVRQADLTPTERLRWQAQRARRSAPSLTAWIEQLYRWTDVALPNDAAAARRYLRFSRARAAAGQRATLDEFIGTCRAGACGERAWLLKLLLAEGGVRTEVVVGTIADDLTLELKALGHVWLEGDGAAGKRLIHDSTRSLRPLSFTTEVIELESAPGCVTEITARLADGLLYLPGGES